MDEEEVGINLPLLLLSACLLLLLLSGPHPFGNQVKFPI